MTRLCLPEPFNDYGVGKVRRFRKLLPESFVINLWSLVTTCCEGRLRGANNRPKQTIRKKKKICERLIRGKTRRQIKIRQLLLVNQIFVSRRPQKLINFIWVNLHVFAVPEIIFKVFKSVERLFRIEFGRFLGQNFGFDVFEWFICWCGCCGSEKWTK